MEAVKSTLFWVSKRTQLLSVALSGGAAREANKIEIEKSSVFTNKEVLKEW